MNIIIIIITRHCMHYVKRNCLLQNSITCNTSLSFPFLNPLPFLPPLSFLPPTPSHHPVLPSLPPLSLKRELDKLTNDKAEIQRHYIMVSGCRNHGNKYVSVYFTALTHVPDIKSSMNSLPDTYLHMCTLIHYTHVPTVWYHSIVVFTLYVIFSFLPISLPPSLPPYQYYEMSYGLNVEMHKQTEIAKRLNAICAQVIPFLSQEVLQPPLHVFRSHLLFYMYMYVY